MKHIEKPSDAAKALDECFNLIRLLTNGDKDKINHACRALGYPEIKVDLKAGGEYTMLSMFPDLLTVKLEEPWVPKPTGQAQGVAHFRTPSAGKRYVLGFVFNQAMTHVLMLRKIKPANQAGLLNGIGGKVESGEMPVYAMIRECMEEVGVSPTAEQWLSLSPLNFPDAEISCYAARDDRVFYAAKQMEEEQLVRMPLNSATVVAAGVTDLILEAERLLRNARRC